MRNLLRALPAVLPSLAIAVAVPAAPAHAVVGTSGASAKITTTQARIGGRGFGGSFGRRSPGFGTRRGLAPRRSPLTRRRSHAMRNFGRGVLQALGIAYLMHMLFGWGAGGSPLGLLLLAALVLWMVTRRRRRRPWSYA